MENVITAVEQVNPDWLTGALSKNGFLDCGRVITVENKLTKKLSWSVVSRLEIGYSNDAPASAPGKLFLKISGDHPQEAEFYNLIASQINAPPFIRCYDAAYSPESGIYYLLLDDLSETHFQPEAPHLPAKAYCESAVESLARLHALWWEDTRLGKEIGKIFDEKWLRAFTGELEKNVNAFLDFLGSELSVRQRQIYQQVLSSKYKIWGRLTDAKGLTVTHGDAHWWNFLYPLNPDKHRVCLFDWQLWHIDLGARDLAFLVSLGGFSECGTELEQNLIRRYYDSLIARGVKRYSREDFWRDYRASAVRNLNIPVIQWQQGRNEELWRANLAKALLAYENLECSRLFDN